LQDFNTRPGVVRVPALLLATRNAHKTREFAAILGSEFSISDLSSFEQLSSVEETGRTFTENAVLKAVTISRLVPGVIAADDSGLEVVALRGAPGIFSARYAGEYATDSQNVSKLLRELGDEKNRRARFCCAIALARDGEQLAIFDGTVEGEITFGPRGENGFGYDPVFIPSGFDQTFAELDDATKNRISHRARAIAQLREYLTATA
jgi:XTP/dITP diphosphohydrolase